jgi:flagellar basal body-associated protein FliL
MANSTDQRPTKDQAEEQESDLSLEQLDSMILSAAPDFADDLKDMKSLPSDGSIDLDVIDTGQTFPLDENPWMNPIGIRKFLVMLLPFLPRLWDFQYRFFSNLYLYRTRFQTFLRELGPRTLQGLKSAGKIGADVSKQKIVAFKGLTWPLKIVAMCLILLGLFTVVFVYRSMTRGVLPGDQEYLIASLEEWAGHTYKYDPEVEMDSFYDSPRTIQNIMSLPKMIVNIHTSKGSGPNPMAAMEFFLEGLSPEAIVEVKDRETEIRDLFQRTLEEMSYSDLDSTEGKQQLTEKLRQTLNMNLTKGKIRRVFIKELVLKP